MSHLASFFPSYVEMCSLNLDCVLIHSTLRYPKCRFVSCLQVTLNEFVTLEKQNGKVFFKTVSSLHAYALWVQR